MEIGVLIQLVGGLLALGAGVRQALRVPLWRRTGISSAGSVVRVDQVWDAAENIWLYAPVVAFRDEQGTRREFATGTSTTWQSHQRGEQVTVLYPPGRPEVARLKSSAHNALWLVSTGLSAVFILKVACEQAAEAALPGRATSVCAGLISGPGDPFGAFTSWALAMAGTGVVPCAARPAQPVQVTDVRDLAAFLLSGERARRAGYRGRPFAETARDTIEGALRTNPAFTNPH